MSRLPVLLFILAQMLAACSTPYKDPVFAAKEGGDTTFPGIAGMLGKNPLDMLLVHGMCTHDATWADTAIRNIYDALGGNPADVRLEPKAVEGTAITLYQQTLWLGDKALRANAVLWSPVTTPIKADLCYDQTHKSKTCPAEEAKKTYPYTRAKLNRIIKDTIMDDCLSDALIYQGKARDEISAQMQQAILEAVATSGGSSRSVDVVTAAASQPPSISLVVITESLGSKLAFDAIYRLANTAKTQAAGERTFERISHIYMEANQLPILALADRGLIGLEAEAAKDYPPDPLDALIRKRVSLKDGAWKVPGVVAFTDPNDLLSFILAPSPHAARAKYPVVDVIVSNDDTYLGSFELPTTAHMTYDRNRAVRRLLACGNPTSKDCK